GYDNNSRNFAWWMLPIDRIQVLLQSVCCRLLASFARKLARKVRHLKKPFFILAAIVLTPVLLVSVVVLASSEWRSIGQTESGDKVSVSSVRSLKNNQRIALVRVEYKEPATLPQGGPFVEMRARVRFNCANGATSPTSVWFYTRDRSGRFVV